MDSSTFKKSLSSTDPPSGSSVYLQALWCDANEQWDKAHELIQDVNDKKAAWIHAYLHRKEGDLSNADYWYNRAGKRRFMGTLNEEWEELVTAFL